jgi:hypothetical protein
MLCHYTECHYAEWRNLRHNAQYHYTECCHADCHAECLNIGNYAVIMLSAINPGVVMLSAEI